MNGQTTAGITGNLRAVKELDYVTVEQETIGRVDGLIDIDTRYQYDTDSGT